MIDVEWWVMKIVAKGCAHLAAREQHPDLDIRAALARGDLQVIGDDICEPIEAFDDQEGAMSRAVREHTRTGVEHKVTLNATLGI